MSQTWDIDQMAVGVSTPAQDQQRIIDGFNALRSVFSGASEPASADQVAYMFWADTTAMLLKQRNSTNTAWITVGTLDATTLGLLSRAGGNLTGGVNDAKTTVASAATPDIFATTVGNVVDYTGTTTATGFATAPQAGARRTLICAAAAPFTAGANVLIDGVASGDTYTARAGERLDVIALTTTQFLIRPSSGWIVRPKQATTSGSSFDFSNIPAGVREILVLFDSVSLNGTDNILVQLGDAGGVETTGYTATSIRVDSTGGSVGGGTVSGLIAYVGNSTHAACGLLHLALLDAATNTWVANHALRMNSSESSFGGGVKALSDTLTTVRVTRATSDTFDAGSVTVAYRF